MVLVRWAPYAVVFVAYLAWRALVLGFPTYQPRGLTAVETDGAEALGRLVGGVIGAMYTATVGAWAQVFSLPGPAEVGRKVFLAGALVVIAVTGVAFLTLRARDRASASSQPPSGWSGWSVQALMFGVAAMAAGGLPVWVTQLPVSVEYPWDRLTLPLMLGACLAMAGALQLLRPATLRVALALALLGLSAGVHFRSNLTYVDESEGLRQFLWQLSWRIPDLEKGTTVVTNDIPLHYYSDNSLTAPLNWMYSPNNHSLDMDYMLYYPTVRVGLALSEPKPGLPIRQAYRAAQFEGSTSQLLALYYAPPGCVHVLDVVLDNSMPNLPASLSAWVPLSRLDLIRADTPGRPRSRLCIQTSRTTIGATTLSAAILPGSSATGRPLRIWATRVSPSTTPTMHRNGWSSWKDMRTSADWTLPRSRATRRWHRTLRSTAWSAIPGSGSWARHPSARMEWRPPPASGSGLNATMHENRS